MSDQMLNDLMKKVNEISEQIDNITEYVISRDRVTNAQFCEHFKITDRTRQNWVNKGCPQLDTHHMSLKAGIEWRRKEKHANKK